MVSKPKFRRTDGHNYSKLGVRRKKKQVYRKPRGIDNKIKLNMKGHVRKVKIGFRNAKAGRDLVKGKEVVMIFNINDLSKIKKGMIGVVGKIGDKKKKEIAEKVLKDDVRLLNLDAKKFLDKIGEKIKVRKEMKSKRNEKIKAKDKKAKEKEEAEKNKKESEKKDEGGDKLEDKIGEKGNSKGDRDEVKRDQVSESKKEVVLGTNKKGRVGKAIGGETNDKNKPREEGK